MTRSVPLVPTIVVLLAVVTMVALGFWQLSRKQEKEALLARYERARSMSSDVAWPSAREAYPDVLYRHARVYCARVEGMSAVAGRSLRGDAGWAHLAHCGLRAGGSALVALGWSDAPTRPRWSGGEVGGFIGPAGKDIRLVAAPPQAGLAQLALPDPKNLPNNHLSYAVQWFAFAVTALVIYALALRKRGLGD